MCITVISLEEINIICENDRQIGSRGGGEKIPLGKCPFHSLFRSHEVRGSIGQQSAS